MFFLAGFFITWSSYLNSAMALMLLVMFLMLMVMSGAQFLKFIVLVIYVSGVVVFIMYVSCLCSSGGGSSKMGWVSLLFCLVVMDMWNMGDWLSECMIEGGSDLWMYVFISYVFYSLVNVYSLLLFQSYGSLRC